MAWLDWRGSGVEGSKIELANNRLIFDQLYFTLLYSASLSINPNKPLGLGGGFINVRLEGGWEGGWGGQLSCFLQI